MKHKREGGVNWAAVGVGVAVLAIIATFLVPQGRRATGLEKKVRAPSTASNSEAPKQPPISPAVNRAVSKPEVSQKANIKLTRHENAAGNIATGHHNLAGNNNQPAPPSAPLVQVNNAPNGIAISGGIVNNPAVNNYGPPPPPTPTVTICVSHSAAPNAQQNLTTITFNTDIQITEPWYALFFDGPVLDGNLEMKGHSVGFIHTRADKMPQPETSFAFKVTSVDFGTDIWRPGEEIAVMVPSKAPVRLIKLLSGSVEAALPEKMRFPCGN